MFRSNMRTDSIKAKHSSPQYIEFTPTLNEVDEEQGCVCLTWSTTEEEDDSNVACKELNTKTQLYVISGFLWLYSENVMMYYN